MFLDCSAKGRSWWQPNVRRVPRLRHLGRHRRSLLRRVGQVGRQHDYCDGRVGHQHDKCYGRGFQLQDLYDWGAGQLQGKYVSEVAQQPDIFSN